VLVLVRDGTGLGSTPGNFVIATEVNSVIPAHAGT